MECIHLVVRPLPKNAGGRWKSVVGWALAASLANSVIVRSKALDPTPTLA